MESLYSIKEMCFNTLESLDAIEDEKEREEATKEVLEEIKSLVVSKSRNIIAYDRQKEINLLALDTEIKRLQEMKKREETKQDNFRKYVGDILTEMGIDKVETEIGTIAFRKKPLSVEVPDEVVDKLPLDVVVQKIEIKPDKKAIKELYKDKGIMLEGVIYHDDEKTITIK